LAGDELHATVNGWADPDPNDPAGKMFLLYYDVEIFEGTGELAGASGCGTIKGAFLFAGPDGLDDTDFRDDKFCDLYAGSATWKYDGVLIFPHHRK
jgi:hypothetical protein